MTFPKDQQVHDSIQSLKSEIVELEAALQDENLHQRPRVLKSVARRMLLSAQRVDELVWAS
jgi:hypothetical protein